MNPIIEHLQNNMAVYIVAALAILPPFFYFRKYTFPTLYHTIEYVFYCGIVHYFFGGLMRVFTWFRGETAFKNYDGSIDSGYTGYNTPLGFNFWDKAQYSPVGLFYAEIVFALIILYVVIFLRPTSYRKRNWKISTKKEKVGVAKPRYDRSKTNKFSSHQNRA
ncbi:MAG: hypothetical protein COA73_12925 [Candidatus Hydrogenedentota bacterium]|nr:MAG: hypothetical protein COA73_12925 [Candidatus Hydrogenedentota bacterium]